MLAAPTATCVSFGWRSGTALLFSLLLAYCVGVRFCLVFRAEARVGEVELVLWWVCMFVSRLDQTSVLNNWPIVQVFLPATPFAALCLAVTLWTPAAVDVFLATATLLVCMSQQFHAWAHMKKSQLPTAVDALQVRPQN